MVKKIIIAVCYFCCFYSTAQSQTVPLTFQSFDNDLRVLQLQGKLTLENSFTQRPIFFNRKFSPDSFYQTIQGHDKRAIKEAKLTIGKKFGKFTLLPFTHLVKITSNQPYGWSDGPLMPVNGIQQLASLGVYGELGPISFQYRPEFLYVNNRSYATTPSFGPNSIQPTIKKYFHGQSRVSLNAGPVSVGLSTENIWWGPGQHTALLMSNNAPGFLHASFQTRRPIKTFLGNFEFQIIGGMPQDDTNQSDEIYNLNNYYQIWGKSNTLNQKYLNGINLNFSPKKLNGLTFGFTRSFISGAGSTIDDVARDYGYLEAYLPIFNEIFKEKRIGFEDSLKWNQLASVYARYVFKKAKAEIYLEYGWNDYTYNIRDLMMSPSHSAAFIFGVKKIVDLTPKSSLDLSFELNQMSQSPNYLVRDAGNWYIHWYQSNYSNFGEVLGSGIGNGSNSLVASATYRKHFNQIGIVFERVNRNPVAQLVQWHDISFGLVNRIQLNKFLFQSRLSPIFSKNHGWSEANNKTSFMGMMGISYFF